MPVAPSTTTALCLAATRLQPTTGTGVAASGSVIDVGSGGSLAAMGKQAGGAAIAGAAMDSGMYMRCL